MDWNEILQFARAKVFEITTIILAVVAILFACIQFGDSRKQLAQSAKQLEQSREQLKQLAQITSSIQTTYVGEFPHNLDEIMNVVNNVSEDGELEIMVDFAGYAIYSRNPAYQSYFNALVQDRQKNVTIKMLVYDQLLAEAALRTQFKESDFTDEKKANFRGFFESHPPSPENYEEFLRLILTLQDHSVQAMCDIGIQVRLVPGTQKYLFFLWGNNSPQAVFAFRNESAKNRELSFRSVDRSLIEVFKTVFDQAWENADPRTHATLRPACKDFRSLK